MFLEVLIHCDCCKIVWFVQSFIFVTKVCRCIDISLEIPWNCASSEIVHCIAVLISFNRLGCAMRILYSPHIDAA